MPEGWLSFTWYDKLVKLYEISDEFRDGSVNNPRHFYTTCFQLSCRKSALACILYTRKISRGTPEKRKNKLSRAMNCRHHPTGTGSSCLTMIHGFKMIVRSVTSFTLLTLTRHLLATTTQLSRGSYEQQGRNRDTTTSTSLIARHWPPTWKAFSSSNMFLILFNSMLR